MVSPIILSQEEFSQWGIDWHKVKRTDRPELEHSYIMAMIELRRLRAYQLKREADDAQARIDERDKQ